MKTNARWAKYGHRRARRPFRPDCLLAVGCGVLAAAMVAQAADEYPATPAGRSRPQPVWTNANSYDAASQIVPVASWQSLDPAGPGRPKEFGAAGSVTVPRGTAELPASNSRRSATTSLDSAQGPAFAPRYDMRSLAIDEAPPTPKLFFRWENGSLRLSEQAEDANRDWSTSASEVHSSSAVDGTWREDGEHVIINLNGQQFRLVKSAPPATTNGAATEVQPTGGRVYGQLLHQRRPVVGCEVALVPLRKTWTGYTIANSDDDDLPTTKTDAFGNYHFTNVPVGLYKVKWRPAGEQSWIRRAEIRPDVRVSSDKSSQVKEVGSALRTIN